MADSKRALFARVFTAPTLICASRVAPCRQTKRLIINLFMLILDLYSGESFSMLSVMHVAKHAAKINLELF